MPLKPINNKYPSLTEHIKADISTKYAVCDGCKVIFIDDYDPFISVICPKCRYAINRGLAGEDEAIKWLKR